jgi:hypothetical protein
MKWGRRKGARFGRVAAAAAATTTTTTTTQTNTAKEYTEHDIVDTA